MDISIIIPTLNRAGYLQMTLDSIIRQKAGDFSFEVIVVDNGSTDGTKAVCDEYAKRFQHFVYCYDDVPGQLTGRHRGLQLSKGEMLCYLDDDVELNEGWLTAIHRLSREHDDISIFGGSSLPKFAADPPQWLNRFWEATPYGGAMCLPLSCIDLNEVELVVDPMYVFGLNFSIRKKALLELKGFHPDCIPSQLQRYQGDGETGLAIKAAMQNVKAMHSSLLTLHHQVPAERMTEEYFKKWSFYNGVCQSFTDIRYANALYTRAHFAGTGRGLSLRADILSSFNSIAKRVSAGISRRLAKRDGWSTLSQTIHETYNTGYAFHQQAFNSDPNVRSWVLKPDYLDYAIPHS